MKEKRKGEKNETEKKKSEKKSSNAGIEPATWLGLAFPSSWI